MTKKIYHSFKIIGILCFVICGAGLLYALLSAANNPDTSKDASVAYSQPKGASHLEASPVDKVPAANDSVSGLENCNAYVTPKNITIAIAITVICLLLYYSSPNNKSSSNNTKLAPVRYKSDHHKTEQESMRGNLTRDEVSTNNDNKVYDELLPDTDNEQQETLSIFEEANA